MADEHRLTLSGGDRASYQGTQSFGGAFGPGALAMMNSLLQKNPDIVVAEVETVDKHGSPIKSRAAGLGSKVGETLYASVNGPVSEDVQKLTTKVQLLTDRLKECHASMNSKDLQLNEKEEIIRGLSAQLGSKDTMIQQKDRELAQKDEEIKRKDLVIEELMAKTSSVAPALLESPAKRLRVEERHELPPVEAPEEASGKVMTQEDVAKVLAEADKLLTK